MSGWAMLRRSRSCSAEGVTRIRRLRCIGRRPNRYSPMATRSFARTAWKQSGRTDPGDNGSARATLPPAESRASVPRH